MVVWRSLVRWVTRLFVAPGLVMAAIGDPVGPEYPVDNSMSTLARFPWIWTCTQAISSDMAGTPLVAVRQRNRTDVIDADQGEQVLTRSANREQRRALIARHRHRERLRLVGVTRGLRAPDREIVDDPALGLLAQPNAGDSGFLLAKQLWVDFVLTGNWLLWTPDGADSVAIYRLHPAEVFVIPGFAGIPAGYEIRDASGNRQVLPVEQVIHCRDVSWQNNASSAWGESPIRCLHDDLTADLGARTTESKVAAKGRPDVLFSVKGGLAENTIGELQSRWEKATKSRIGAFIVGDDVTATPLGWSPTEFATKERADRLRDTTLAVMGVPPTRAGVTTASYGAARQEARVYWESLRGRARAFEDALSRLAKPGVRLEYDYSAVEALQVSYTERLMRVSTWVGLGADPREAAQYEGFDESPLPDAVDPASATPAVPIDRQPEEPQDDRAVRAAIELHLRCAEVAYGELEDGLVDRTLFVRWQTERLFHALQTAGLEPEASRWWAEELAAVTDELVRSGAEAPFAPERAARAADRIGTWLRRAA